MGNAVKFTERDHVQLRVNDEQCRLHLTIQDTGNWHCAGQARTYF